MDNTFDLIVIGAGPGGYVAAIKAARLGKKTAIVENIRVGGTCLNRGCIPAKAMLHASSLYREMQEAERFGVCAGQVSYDYAKILAYKEDTTDKLCQGVEQLLKANGVAIYYGQGTLEKEKKVRVRSGEEETILHAGHILLAAGSKPLLLPLPGMDLPGVLTSDDIFKMKAVPDSLIIIGGGVISVEFATVFAALGCKVTILEAMPRLVPNLDKDIAQNLKLILKKRGIDIHTAAAVKGVEQQENLYTRGAHRNSCPAGGSAASCGLRYACLFVEKEKEIRVTAQYVLCAVGRTPNIEGLFAPGAEPELERGRVVVNERFESSLKDVYAVGDIIKGMQLAHTASAQGSYVAELLFGNEPDMDLTVVPSCVYTDPEIASVGINEEEAKEKGIEIRTGKFLMSANGKSLITKEERGFVKVIVEAESEVLLGAQLMCARATDMIGELATAVANRLTVKALLKAMKAHPTYNEGVAEALEDVNGKAIHIMPAKKKQV